MNPQAKSFTIITQIWSKIVYNFHFTNKQCCLLFSALLHIWTVQRCLSEVLWSKIGSGTFTENTCGSLVSWAFSENHNAYTSYKQPWMQLSLYFRGHVYQISHKWSLELISHCLNCSCKVFDCSRKKCQRSQFLLLLSVGIESLLSFSSEQKPFWGPFALPHFNSKWTGAWKKPLVLVFWMHLWISVYIISRLIN